MDRPIPSHHVQVLLHPQAVPGEGGERGRAVSGGFGTMTSARAATLMRPQVPIVPVVLVETGPSRTGASGTVSCGASWWIAANRVPATPASTASSTEWRRRGARSRLLPCLPVVAHRRRQPRLPAHARAHRHEIGELQHEFGDILKGPLDQAPGPVPQELTSARAAAAEHPVRPLVLSRLRRLIDRVNSSGAPRRLDSGKRGRHGSPGVVPSRRGGWGAYRGSPLDNRFRRSA